MYLEDWQKLFKTNIDKLLNSVLRSIENIITDLNSQNQLKDKGVSSNNKSLGEYRPYTIEYKRSVNQIYSHVTLEDSGDFYKGFYVKYTPTSFTIWSTDGKTNSLIADWGSDIFGLSEDSINELIKGSVYPEIMKVLKNGT